MHTMGHPAGDRHGASGGMMAAVRSADLPAGSASDLMVRQADEPATGMVMNPLDVCLAVLVGGLVLMWAAALGWVRSVRSRQGCAALAGVPAGRGPPNLFGLVLADLSVQRT